MVNRAVTPTREVPLEFVATTAVRTTLPVSVEPEPNRTTPLEHLERLEPVEPMASPDHEFSLPAIATAAAVNLDTLTEANLAVDVPLRVESLEIADLPLTSESFAPR